MVKNYLVCAVRPISQGWHIEKNQDLYVNYRRMYDLRTASFQKFCQEPFETRLWEEPSDNSDHCTQLNWQSIRDLWHSEPCNILWAGADTLMIKPTSVFGDRFKEYRLFNYTDPRSHREFPHYFNDDIQYYPHTMAPEIWHQGEELWAQRDSHPDRHWGFDQNRHNAMFWSQDIPITDRLHPWMAWQAMNLRSLDANMVRWHEQWNQLAFDRAHVLHFHASRGSQEVIDLMLELCKQLDIMT